MTFKDLAFSQPDGYVRLRMNHWADERDYLRVYVSSFNGEKSFGPVAHLFAPIQQALDYESPQEVLLLGVWSPSRTGWELYAGPLHEKDK